MRVAVFSAWVTLAVAFAPLASRYSRHLSGSLGKASWDFALSGAAVLALLTAVLAAFGAHAVVAAHPKARGGNLAHTAHYWATAAVLAATAVIGIPRIPTPALQVGGILVFGVLLGAVLALEHATVDAGERAYTLSRWALNALDYLIGLGVFAAAVTILSPGALGASFAGLAAALLAVDVLRQPGRTPDSAALLVPAIGVLIGLAAARILLWDIPPVRAALLLLLLLYALTGILLHYLQRSLRWWVQVEYFALLLLGGWALLRWFP